MVNLAVCFSECEKNGMGIICVSESRRLCCFSEPRDCIRDSVWRNTAEVIESGISGGMTLRAGKNLSVGQRLFVQCSCDSSFDALFYGSMEVATFELIRGRKNMGECGERRV